MTNVEGISLEEMFFDYLDQVKFLFTKELWDNEILNCSKNELFILFLIYRKQEVNMSQIAQYIAVPLNTATGIVARMEKKGLILRQRSEEDKRIVTITMTEEGNQQVGRIMKELMHYGNLIFENFTSEEMAFTFRLIDKLMDVLKQERNRRMVEQKETKIRKITIE
ncbi:MarR family winged helix-turn-helix transcriptional regulator [Anaerosporobacter faecicola]|uniref:MarR family winged helix-turn-helix transcriptional regulator n=1 Tax=Anaerosporobacter faecicola TaxID=2718714 RepID=UPI00143C3E71|nr:MarR family transcriptional regulator [Anaerosporobacter faecicola]